MKRGTKETGTPTRSDWHLVTRRPDAGCGCEPPAMNRSARLKGLLLDVTVVLSGAGGFVALLQMLG